MKIIDGLIQGTPAWHAHRATHLNASDAPAMMGVSPYKTRSELVREYATGMSATIDAATQTRFDEGHRTEALARPLAEKIIGEELYPVTGEKGKLSASFDGITLMENITFEHKSLNDEIRAAKSGADLPLYLRVQIEQQFDLAESAEKCLFMASKWAGETLIEEVHHWVYPDLELRVRINAAWAQFELDVANYQHVEVLPPVTAAPIIALPALSIKVEGSIALQSNLTLFGEKLRHFIDGLDKNPSTDQAFADAEAAVKVFKNAEDALEAAEANALAQTASVDEMRRTVAMLKDLSRNTRLTMEKIVKARKETIRIEIATEAKAKFSDHIESLNKRIGRPYMPTIVADFAGAMKGLKTITSVRNAVDTEMARAKIEANEIADKLQANLESLRTLAEGHKFLFADVMQIVMKENADLVLLIESRIAAHEKAKAEEAEAMRVKIEAQEKAKAEAAAAETLRRQRAEDEARIAAEQRAAQAAIAPQPAKAQDSLALRPTQAQDSLIAPSVHSVDTGAMVNLGTINAALGFTVSAEFLAKIGFDATQQKNARLYREADLPHIYEAIERHVFMVRHKAIRSAEISRQAA